MNMTDVATWGQLTSSAAVLVTLVYLSIQTRQTARLMLSESRQSMIDTDMVIVGQQIGWPTLFTALYGEDEITSEDKARLWTFLLGCLRTREHQWIQYRNGVLDEHTWAAYHKPLIFLLGTERTRAWWRTMGRNYVSPGFAETVDALIEGPPNTDMYQLWLAWN